MTITVFSMLTCLRVRPQWPRNITSHRICLNPPNQKRPLFSLTDSAPNNYQPTRLLKNVIHSKQNRTLRASSHLPTLEVVRNARPKHINHSTSWKQKLKFIPYTTTYQDFVLSGANTTYFSTSSVSSNVSPIFHSPQPIVSKFPYNILPVKTHPYLNLMRISAPIGTYLLYLPCTWSILMSSYLYIDTPLLETLKMLSLFAIGSFIMRGAGCTINDMWDRNFDKKVERTKSRPLASDQISMFNALSFLGLQLTAGLGILLQLNWYSVFLGASSLGLVATYPLMKRVTYWPQAFLGLTFNWGALLGWTAIAGHSDLEVMLPLYAAGLSWTLVYDTIYAHQDKHDDAIVGIKSTALLFAQQTKPIISLFSASTLSLLSLAGYMNDQTLPYYIGLCAAGIHMANSVRKVDLDNRESCNRTFDSMKWVGVLIGLGAAMDWALKKRQEEEQKKVVESA